MEKIKNLEENEGMPERCTICYEESFGKPRHTKECIIGKELIENKQEVEIIDESEKTGIESLGEIKIEKKIKGIQDNEFEKFTEGYERQLSPEDFEKTDKPKKAIKIIIKEPEFKPKPIKKNSPEITDKDIDNLFNEPLRVEKIIPQPELEKKESENETDLIFTEIQNEISYFKLNKIHDKQKNYLKNSIKNILKGYLIKTFKKLRDIEDIRLSRGDWLENKKREVFLAITSEIKEKILSKYGYPSDIMKIFQDAVKEISEDKDINIFINR